MARIEFVAPAHMENLAGLRGWLLGEPPPAGAEVLIDLSRWRRVTPNPVVGVIAVAARYSRLDNPIEIVPPDDAYARRMLGTVGFLEALSTFAEWTDEEIPLGSVARLLPIIPVRNFRTHDQVEDLMDEMQETFSANHRIPSSLLVDATTALGEAADNVIWHAECGKRGDWNQPPLF